jgi:translation elongation factor EF-4
MENLTKTFDLDTIKVYPDQDYNFKKDQDACIVCGKPTNLNDKTKYVHITTDFIVVERNYLGDDSQGCYPIGNSCCKKLPKSLVFQY